MDNNGKVLSSGQVGSGVKIIDDTDGEISSYSVKSVYEKK